MTIKKNGASPDKRRKYDDALPSYYATDSTCLTDLRTMFPHRLPATLLAAGLLPSSLGCSKKTDSPPPAVGALEGSWNHTQGVAKTYNDSGVQIAQQTYTVAQGNTQAARYTTFTGTTMQLFMGTGTALTGPQPYARSGNTLNVDPLPAYYIKQLTATELTTFTVVPGSFQSSHTDYEMHSTRR